MFSFAEGLRDQAHHQRLLDMYFRSDKKGDDSKPIIQAALNSSKPKSAAPPAPKEGQLVVRDPE